MRVLHRLIGNDMVNKPVGNVLVNKESIDGYFKL